MLFFHFSNIRRTQFDQNSAVRLVSKSKGGWSELYGGGGLTEIIVLDGKVTFKNKTDRQTDRQTDRLLELLRASD